MLGKTDHLTETWPSRYVRLQKYDIGEKISCEEATICVVVVGFPQTLRHIRLWLPPVPLVVTVSITFRCFTVNSCASRRGAVGSRACARVGVFVFFLPSRVLEMTQCRRRFHNGLCVRAWEVELECEKEHVNAQGNYLPKYTPCGPTRIKLYKHQFFYLLLLLYLIEKFFRVLYARTTAHLHRDIAVRDGLR